jgi:DNA-directed RNA polymerase subunit M/transcription elongation factor TFIIS
MKAAKFDCAECGEKGNYCIQFRKNIGDSVDQSIHLCRKCLFTLKSKMFYMKEV